LVAILACFGYNEATKRRRKTMTMGEKILNMRKARGWNQEELAERVGVTRQAVSRWEAGSAKPDADKIITICDLFGVSADYLLRDQYSGEGSAAQPEKQPVNALAEKAQSMTQQQRAAGIASAIGGLIIFALKLIHILKDTNYYYYTVTGEEIEGFRAFLINEELVLLWYPAMIAFLGGLIYLIIWPVIKKDKENNPFPSESD
jgi:transcriptional regulator with XRE-family HTH domain